MSKKSVHVVPNPRGGWSVRKAHASRSSRNFDNQKDAVEYGKNISKNEGGEFIVHRRDGMIKSSSSYGNDPNPPKDRDNRK
jgi:hypothetical protein